MFPLRNGMVIILIALFMCGCGDGRIRPRGRLIKNGAPFPLAEGEGMRISFVPMVTDGSTYDSYFAVYNKDDGSFKVVGKDGKGLPPGKYRVAVEHIKKNKDLFKGTYSAKHTPFIYEVTDSSDEVVIDLDKPTS